MWYIIYSISPICVLFVHKIRCPSFDTIQYFDVGCNVQVSASDNMPAVSLVVVLSCGIFCPHERLGDHGSIHL